MKPVGTTDDAIRVSCNALFVHKIKMHMMGFIEHETTLHMPRLSCILLVKGRSHEARCNPVSMRIQSESN